MSRSEQTKDNTTLKFQDKAYEEKVNAVENFVKSNFDKSLENFIRGQRWKENPDLCVDVVSDRLTVEDQKYLNEKLGGLRHLKDRRSAAEYACDLILGWVVEDGILKILEDEIGFKCVLSSADKNREFLKRPEASSDIRLEISKEHQAHLELVKDFTGYWKKNRKIDLRDAKYSNLKREKGILLGLDFKNASFFILSLAQTKAEYIKSHYPYGGKPAYSVSLRDTGFYDFSIMKDVLRKFFQDWQVRAP
jgi:hypothetical protein